MPMLLNLPKLIPDQTLYSWCGWVQAWNGLGPVATSRCLFGSPSAALMHDFPSFLGLFTERTEKKFGEARAVALRHTLLGYFLPHAPASLAEHLLQRVVMGSIPDLKMKLGIPASRIGGRHPLKGCPACFEEDEGSHGFAYWHVAEQLPSVMVCRKHRRPLQIAWDPVTPVHRREWLLPKRGLKRDWIEVPVTTDEQMERLLSVATLSVHFAAMEPGTLDPMVLAKTYQLALRGRGLATEKGSLRIAALVRATRSHYRGIEDVPGFEALRAITADWPGLAGALARRRPKPGHPLKHILLLSMLFDTWAEFRETYSEALAGTEEPIHSPAVDSSALLRDAFRQNVIDGDSIRAASAKADICTTTGVKWANQLGLAFTARTKSFTAAQKRKARRKLLAGSDVDDVATEFGVSRITINRLLGSDPNLQEAWRFARFVTTRTQVRKRFQALLATHPNLPVKALRSIPGNGYMWLYRHDRPWLLDHLPALWQPSRPR